MDYPLDSAIVELYRNSKDGEKVLQTTRSASSSGWFSFSDVPSGKYLLRAHVPDLFTHSYASIKVSPGYSRGSVLRVSLVPYPECSGSIRTENERNLESETLAAQVRTEFLHAWSGYKKYAWGEDDLKPLSKTHHNWYAQPLLMTPVDALDTLVLMGLKDEAKETTDYIATHLSFDKDISVQNFEVTIRLLGGLLSGYQMTGDKRLLDLADDLGQRLLPVFDSKTGIPYRYVNLKTGKTSGEITNPAEAGTLLIEFGTLSKLTQKPVYYDKAKLALKAVFERRSKIGLVGSRINVNTGEWVGTNSHISGGIDSYYEYLLKCWKLFGDQECRDMWRASIVPVNKYLSDKVEGRLWYGQADMKSGKRSGTTFGALDAFFPAVLALSGDVGRAKRLQESAFLMWNKEGIEPEVYNYVTGEIVYPGYPLRPEIVESAYYLHHFTKDPKYLEMGKKMFGDFRKYCRTDAGYASLKSVITKEQSDSMQSFVLAETFKYFYLLFAPERTLDLDKVVFNTEAHPVTPNWKGKN